jgi:hypothetical protein
MVVGEADSAKLGCGFTDEPIPNNSTIWGLPGALSLIVRFPFDCPVDVGEKTKLITQLAPLEIGEAERQEPDSAKPFEDDAP